MSLILSCKEDDDDVRVRTTLLSSSTPRSRSGVWEAGWDTNARTAVASRRASRAMVWAEAAAMMIDDELDGRWAWGVGRDEEVWRQSHTL